ncbi:MAG TPA: PSD1 and planctomycete cytochrome C domain-containing protein [Planctomycetaceae bacterium]
MALPRLRPLPAALAAVLLAGSHAASASDEEFFETKVRPLLASRCFECHGAQKQQGEVRLDAKAGMFADGPAGRLVVPGKPDESRLLQVVAYEPYDTQMPPTGKLPAEEIAVFTEWVRKGAPWPDAAEASSPGGPGTYDFDAARAGHWAFRPVAKPVPPDVKDAASVGSPIDRFLLAELEKHGVGFSPPADRRTLLRRVYFDLVGVPPTADEIAAFQADESPDAFAKVVDRLLASPLYGQRWGRHWLDVARYADTKGYVFTEDPRYPYAYTYRDYVVEAFNADKPFDRFVLEQLAADQLGLPENAKELAALGFLTVGRRNLNNRPDILDDRIDVTSRGFMALTVACARCHDHKYDPIPAADYYSLYGVFDSCDDPDSGDLPLIGTPAQSQAFVRFQQELERRQAEVAKYVAEQRDLIAAEMRRRAGDYLLGVLKGDEAAPGLRRRGVGAWREFLGKVAADDPVWGPWKRLSGLPAEGFADQAKAAVEAMRQETPYRDGLGKFVLDRLTSEPLGRVEDLCRAYGTLLAQTVDRPADLPPEQTASLDAIAAELAKVGPPFALTDDQAKELFDRAQRNEERERQRKVDEFRANSDAAPPRAMVLRDRATPVEPVVFVRGNPGRPGDRVPRQFLRLLSGDGREPFAKDASGRLDLAKAIADPANPLTARVIVNRVWQHHFGEGIVRTPSDFGTRADPPTHPALLDWLAAEFVEGGWSVKRLHRMIVLSAAYRQSSAVSDFGSRIADSDRDNPQSENLDPQSLDPENRLLWRMNPRRLDFEAMRDATLAVAGRLDPALGGRPVDLFGGDSPRRTIYGFVNRNDLPGVWRSFDFPTPDASVGERSETTVPQQALFAMNSPFVLGQAKALAARPEVAASATPEAKAAALYRIALQRDPAAEELGAAAAFLAGEPMPGSDLSRTEQLAQVLLLANEFLFID